MQQYLIVVLLFALMAASGCTDVGSKAMTGDEIVDRFVAQQESVRDYTAAFTRTIGLTLETPFVDTIRIAVKKPYCYQVEYLESLERGNGTLAVSDGQEIWWYYPSENSYRQTAVNDPTRTTLTELDYQTTAGTILKENNATYVGDDVIDGEMMYVVEATSDDPLKHSLTLFSKIRVWIDPGSWMAKRVEFFYESEIPIVRVEYSEVRTNFGLLSDICTFVPPEGAQPQKTPEPMGRVTPLQAFTPEQAKDRFGSYVRIPGFVPEGYTFQYALFYGKAEGQTSQFYTRGSEGFQIRVITPPDKPCPEYLTGNATQVTIDGTEGTYVAGEGENQLRWHDENFSYCITGSLDREEMVKVAASME